MCGWGQEVGTYVGRTAHRVQKKVEQILFVELQVKQVEQHLAVTSSSNVAVATAAEH